MGDEAKCCKCGATVSYETGFTMTGGLGDNSQDRIYCPEHAPNQGKGYTLDDLQHMRNRVWATRDGCMSHYPRYCPPDCPNAGKHDDGLAQFCECHRCRKPADD